MKLSLRKSFRAIMKGCLSGICRGRKAQNQYSSRLCREGARFHGIAVPPYWFHSYIFEIVAYIGAVATLARSFSDTVSGK